MIKRATLFWVLLTALAGGGLFIVKYEVQKLEDRLAAIGRDTMEDLEAVHVLKAEWAYLNQPARLEDLGRRLLEMEPVAASQTTTLADIPQLHPDEEAPAKKPPPAPADIIAPLLATLGQAP